LLATNVNENRLQLAFFSVKANLSACRLNHLSFLIKQATCVDGSCFGRFSAIAGTQKRPLNPLTIAQFLLANSIVIDGKNLSRFWLENCWI